MLRRLITSSAANTDDGSCIEVIVGCTDAAAFNSDNSAANTDDNSCIAVIEGCTDATAFNFDTRVRQTRMTWFLYSSYRRLYRCYCF